MGRRRGRRSHHRRFRGHSNIGHLRSRHPHRFGRRRGGSLAVVIPVPKDDEWNFFFTKIIGNKFHTLDYVTHQNYNEQEVSLFVEFINNNLITPDFTQAKCILMIVVMILLAFLGFYTFFSISLFMAILWINCCIWGGAIIPAVMQAKSQEKKTRELQLFLAERNKEFVARRIHWAIEPK